MTILGLDLSMVRTGYSIVKDGKLINSGHFKPAKLTDNTIFKIDSILKQINKTVGEYHIDDVIIEDTFFGLNTRGFKTLVQLGAIVSYYWYRKSGKIAKFIMATSARKKCGLSGKAAKCEVQVFVGQKFDLMDKSQIDYFSEQIANVQEERKNKDLSKSKADSMLIKISKAIERDSGLSTDIADSIIVALSGVRDE